MRTFHNLELIEEVIRNPHGTIGQRNYNLFRCYSFPFEFHTEFVYNDEIKDEINRMPSIEEYVTAQIGEDNLRTVRFDYYIGWRAEDQRALLELCFEKIKEYEEANPVDPKKYSIRLRAYVEKFDLRNHLKHMIDRPAMYGFENLAGIRAYLDGYYKLKKQYGLDLSVFEIKLATYIKYWKNKVTRDLPFDTWDRPFRLERMGTTDFASPSKNWEFERFEEILKEDLKMDLVPPRIIGK